MDKKRSFIGTTLRKVDENSMTIEHIVNTKTLDRYNTFVIPQGAEIENFLKNPVVLWLHNVDNNPVKIPIARCEEIEITEDAIKVKTRFNENDPLSVKVFQAYRDGFLSAWSIGFQPKNFIAYCEENREELNIRFGLEVSEEQLRNTPTGLYVIDKWELHEYSAVPVPANPEALNLAQEEEHCKVLVTRGLTDSTDFSTLVNAMDAAKLSVEPEEKPEAKEKVTEEEIEEVAKEEEKVQEVVEETELEPKEEVKEDVEEEEKTELEKLAEEQGTVEKEVKEEEKDLDVTIIKEPKVKEEATEEAPKEEAPEEKESTEEPKEDSKEDIAELKEDVKELKEEVEKLLGVITIIKNANSDLEKRVVELTKSLEVDNIESIRALSAKEDEAPKEVDILSFIGLR